MKTTFKNFYESALLESKNITEAYDPQTDPNYLWIIDHLHETTSDIQKKNGSYSFHLPAPRREFLLVSSIGYVRVDPNRKAFHGGPAPNWVIARPSGNTPEEILQNAFAKAVEYLKKNL